MDRQTAEQLLYNALQPSEELRVRAEAEIRGFLSRDYPGFLSLFCEILLDPRTLPHLRQTASIIVKNSLHSPNTRIQKGYEQNWLSCTQEFRESLKDALEMNLNIPEKVILWNLARILGSIIRIEVANHVSFAHFQRLLLRISDPKYAVGVLEAAAVACDQLYAETNFIFDHNQAVIVFQLASYYHNASVRDPHLSKACLKCICSSIEIFGDILKDKSIRDNFLQQLMSHKSSSPEVLEMALDAINRLIDAHPALIDSDLPLLASYILSFDNGFDFVIFNIFEFWEILIELKKEIIVRDCLPHLLLKLFSYLEAEDLEDKSWSEHKAASSLLVALNDDLSCNILEMQMVREFISSRLSSPHPSERAVGALVLGNLCNESNSQFLRENVNHLANLIAVDSSSNEILYAIGRICDKDVHSLLPILPSILEKCRILAASKTSVNAIWVFYFTILAAKKYEHYRLSSIIESHYSDILRVLVILYGELTPSDISFKNVVMETLIEFIPACPPKLLNVLVFLNEHLLQQISQLSKHFEIIPHSQVLQQEDILSGYIVLLQLSLSCSEFDRPKVMKILMDCLCSIETSAHGEIYIAISKLFPFPVQLIKPFVELALKSVQSPQPFIAKSALNFLSDSAIQMEHEFKPYLEQTISSLISAIASPSIPLDLKPTIIDLFGDIALAVGSSFEPYIDMSVVLFSQICTLNRASDEEYVDSLYISILNMFSCIFTSLQASPIVRKYLPKILELAKKVAYSVNEWGSKQVLDLIRDIHGGYGSAVLRDTWVLDYLIEQIELRTTHAGSAMSLYQLIK